MANTPRCKRACSNADTIVLQRVLIDDSMPTVDYWMKRGKRILASFDDAYDLIGEENAAYSFWGRGEVEVKVAGQKYTRKLEVHPVDQFRRNLRKISGGVTPGKVLARDWSAHAPMLHLPNYLESKRYFNLPRHDTSWINIGWGGSLSHLTSFAHSGVQQALQNVLSQTHEQKVRLALVGDKRVRKQVPLPDEEIWFREYVMFFDWPKILNTFHIGLAPLAMPYDQRRSRLKVMEYIAMGIPFIATKSEAYEEFWDCPSGIFIDQGAPDVCDKSNPKAWERALWEVLNNPPEFKRRAVQARKDYFKVYDNITNADKIAEILLG
jgi:hypothetical protein